MYSFQEKDIFRRFKMFSETNSIIQEPRKRQTAFRLKISDISSGNAVSNEKINFIEIGNKKVARINILANVVDKFISEGEKKYAALTIDDGSGQIRIKAFGEDIQKLKAVEIGDTILIVGNIRSFNNEVYILPEILKRMDAKWLIARKLEIEKNRVKEPHNARQTANPSSDSKPNLIKNTASSLKEQILGMLKENDDGLDIDKIIMSMHMPVEEINSTVTKMLEEAEIYEPKPGRIRLL
jgi:RPA family protein